jgi:hypothetical protein
MEDILLYEEEKKEIEKLIKKYFKKHNKQVDIINMGKQYPELFSLVKNK